MYSKIYVKAVLTATTLATLTAIVGAPMKWR
jgi:hypothetical protein